MPLIDADFDLLETYLDGELAIADAEGLWRRLATEPELAATLHELRQGRVQRQAAWTAAEPTDEAAGAVTDHVVESIRRREYWARINRGLAYLATAAACLFLGFRAGWIEHGDGLPTPMQPPMAQYSDAGPSSDAAHPAVYPVAIRDQRGNLIAVERFESPQDAADFVNDLNRRPSQPAPQSRDMGTGVVPASFEQF